MQQSYDSLFMELKGKTLNYASRTRSDLCVCIFILNISHERREIKETGLKQNSTTVQSPTIFFIRNLLVFLRSLLNKKFI